MYPMYVLALEKYKRRTQKLMYPKEKKKNSDESDFSTQSTHMDAVAKQLPKQPQRTYTHTRESWE